MIDEDTGVSQPNYGGSATRPAPGVQACLEEDKLRLTTLIKNTLARMLWSPPQDQDRLDGDGSGVRGPTKRRCLGVNDLDPVLLKLPEAPEGVGSPEPAGGFSNKDLWLCSRSDLNMLAQVGPGGPPTLTGDIFSVSFQLSDAAAPSHTHRPPSHSRFQIIQICSHEYLNPVCLRPLFLYVSRSRNKTRFMGSV